MRRRVSITAAAWTAGSPAMASFSVFGSGPLLASSSNATIVSYHPDRTGAGISALVPMARHGTLCLPRAELESESRRGLAVLTGGPRLSYRRHGGCGEREHPMLRTSITERAAPETGADWAPKLRSQRLRDPRTS